MGSGESESERPSGPDSGWYDDPDGRSGIKRYWDGRTWTDRYHPPAGKPGGEPSEKRFASLRTIATVFYVLGWVTAILGTLLVIGLAIAAGEANDTANDLFGDEGDVDEGGSVLTVLIGGGLAVFIYSLAFFAASAFIHLMLSVEDSTRRTASAVEQLAVREQG